MVIDCWHGPDLPRQVPDAAGTCRHVIPLGGVNLCGTGERYCYSHFLLTQQFYDMNPKFFHQDVVCKSGKWFKDASAAVMASDLAEVRESNTFQRIQSVLDNCLQGSWACGSAAVRPWLVARLALPGKPHDILPLSGHLSCRFARRSVDAGAVLTIMAVRRCSRRRRGL